MRAIGIRNLIVDPDSLQSNVIFLELALLIFKVFAPLILTLLPYTSITAPRMRMHSIVAVISLDISTLLITETPFDSDAQIIALCARPVSYTHLRAHETDSYLVC